MKTDSELANLFAAFAHPSRIAILRALLSHGTSGQQFGELAIGLDLSPSTLTHHLREMEAAGVLIREAEGRATRLRLDLAALAGAVGQLTRLCCSADFNIPSVNMDQNK
jgi:DNA-binding transcriptional ArsR family regulator